MGITPQAVTSIPAEAVNKLVEPKGTKRETGEIQCKLEV
jgi:hypothetical protein